jgi:hypothetical protein
MESLLHTRIFDVIAGVIPSMIFAIKHRKKDDPAEERIAPLIKLLKREPGNERPEKQAEHPQDSGDPLEHPKAKKEAIASDTVAHPAIVVFP